MNFPDANGFLDSDYRALVRMANECNLRPEHWLAIASSESGLALHRADPTHKASGTFAQFVNPNGKPGARGETQMMPTTLHNLGWLPGNADFDAAGGDYREVPVEGQIRWSGLYFKDCMRWAHVKSWNNPGDLYLANFLPGKLLYKDNPSYVLAADPEDNYRYNKGFDDGKKGWIDVQDVRNHAARGGLTSAYKVATQSLNAVRQARLNECLPVRGALEEDGIPGPATQDAIDAFRVAAGLPRGGVDGVLDMGLFGTC